MLPQRKPIGLSVPYRKIKQNYNEPVACVDSGVLNWIAGKQFKHAALLYEHPQQRTVVALKDAEMWQLVNDCTIGGDLHVDKFIRAIKTKLKQRNT